MLVIGGGIIGLEMACVYDALGAKVTVVEMLDHLMHGADPDLVRPLAKRIGARYTDVLLASRVEEVKAQKNGLKVEIGGVGSRMFDRVLVAVGRVPNGRAIGASEAGVNVDERGFIPVDAQMKTNVAGIYAIGDIVGEPMLAHKATHEGKVAAEVIAGHDVTLRRQDDPVGRLHRPRGRLDGSDRDRGQGVRRSNTRRRSSPGPPPAGRWRSAATRACRS